MKDKKNSAELPSIEITMKELLMRKSRIQDGISYEQVSKIFGGKEIKREHREGKEVIFWRFMIVDASIPQQRYQIYMGEFEKDRLVFGAILPHGSR